MGVNDRLDRGAAPFQPSTDLLEITARIDHDGFLGLVVHEDGAIASQGADRQGFDDHAASFSTCMTTPADTPAPTRSTATSLVGEMLSERYRIEALLGEGGMGAV